MKKNVFNFLINVAIFWMVCDFFSGFKAPYGPISKLAGGILFTITLTLAEGLRTVLRMSKGAPVRVLIGTILMFGALWFINTLVPNLFSFGASNLGGTNFIFFSIPKITVLQDTNVVLLFTALIANICSIIVFKLRK